MGVTVAIGTFDGVHLGHRALIARARELAGAQGRVTVVTFDPHPAAVVAPEREPALLTTVAERVELLQQAGVDEVLVVSFTADVARRSPEQFVDEFILPLNPDVVCVGRNFRFGAGAAGSSDTLHSLGGQRGFVTVAVDLAGDSDAAWSSTRIRALIAQGDVAAAGQALGRDYQVCGVVVHGDARGRDLGFPTANLDVPAVKAVPADGVYAGWLDVAGSRFAAAVSIGTNPQFAGNSRRVEAHAIDAPAGFDVYGQTACLRFVHRLRGQQVYPDLAALISAIGADVEQVRGLLSLH